MRPFPALLSPALGLVVLLSAPVSGRAQSAPQPAPAPLGTASPAAAKDPVVASVEGHPILLSELSQASQSLPDNLRNMPFDTLFPALRDRMIDHEALVMAARRDGYENRPEIQRAIRAATEKVLESAYIVQQASPKVTEQAIRARYDALYGSKAATEEVRARHILVPTEADARKVLTDLKNGGDFASIARVVSKDPDAAKGGDLGFFRRDQVWSGFADVAFTLSPGQVAPDPIHNEFGWHVVKVEEKREVAPPSYADSHDQIRQELLAAAVQQTIAQARSQLAIHRYNLDGSEVQASAAADTANGPVR